MKTSLMSTKIKDDCKNPEVQIQMKHTSFIIGVQDLFPLDREPFKFETGSCQSQTIQPGRPIGLGILTNTIMKKLTLLWIVKALVAVNVISIEVKMDRGMREGQPSYIFCDVGAVTAGVAFAIEPANVKGSCLGPGGTCSSPIYNITQNATGALLEIASVNVSREQGEWYCQHDTDRSNTIIVNNQTIAGFLLEQNWTRPPGHVHTYSAVMTLSCTNQVPDFSFTFVDSESNTGTVPSEAVSTTSQSSYNGTSCENGNKFYVITMAASYKLDVFNNKTGVTFTFNYYGDNTTAPFSVDFLEYVAELTTESPRTELTTESPRTGTGCDGLCDWEIVTIVVVVVLVILTVVIIIYCLKKKKKFCFKADENKATTGENTTTNNGVRNGTEYPIGLTSR